MFDRKAFEIEKADFIEKARSNSDLVSLAQTFVSESDKFNYGYFWTWMDLPIIQMPEDIVVTQEILWETKPHVVIETGVAWGGSLAMYASFQQLQGFGQTIGIDITIPDHNREAIMDLPVSNRITLFEASSTDLDVFNNVKSIIPPDSDILLVLDSNHTQQHVYEELKIWSPLLRVGNYIIVSDTIVENIPNQGHRPRPWGKGNNPMTGMQEFLVENNRFTNETKYSNKSFSTFNPSGYLKCVS